MSTARDPQRFFRYAEALVASVASGAPASVGIASALAAALPDEDPDMPSLAHAGLVLLHDFAESHDASASARDPACIARMTQAVLQAHLCLPTEPSVRVAVPFLVVTAKGAAHFEKHLTRADLDALIARPLPY
jgi:hypothetical protein